MSYSPVAQTINTLYSDESNRSGDTPRSSLVRDDSDYPDDLGDFPKGIPRKSKPDVLDGPRPTSMVLDPQLRIEECLLEANVLHYLFADKIKHKEPISLRDYQQLKFQVDITYQNRRLSSSGIRVSGSKGEKLKYINRIKYFDMTFPLLVEIYYLGHKPTDDLLIGRATLNFLSSTNCIGEYTMILKGKIRPVLTYEQYRDIYKYARNPNLLTSQSELWLVKDFVDISTVDLPVINMGDILLQMKTVNRDDNAPFNNIYAFFQTNAEVNSAIYQPQAEMMNALFKHLSKSIERPDQVALPGLMEGRLDPTYVPTESKDEIIYSQLAVFRNKIVGDFQMYNAIEGSQYRGLGGDWNVQIDVQNNRINYISEKYRLSTGNPIFGVTENTSQLQKEIILIALHDMRKKEIMKYGSFEIMRFDVEPNNYMKCAVGNSVHYINKYSGHVMAVDPRITPHAHFTGELYPGYKTFLDHNNLPFYSDMLDSRYRIPAHLNSKRLELANVNVQQWPTISQRAFYQNQHELSVTRYTRRIADSYYIIKMDLDNIPGEMIRVFMGIDVYNLRRRFIINSNTPAEDYGGVFNDTFSKFGRQLENTVTGPFMKTKGGFYLPSYDFNLTMADRDLDFFWEAMGRYIGYCLLHRILLPFKLHPLFLRYCVLNESIDYRDLISSFPLKTYQDLISILGLFYDPQFGITSDIPETMADMPYQSATVDYMMGEMRDNAVAGKEFKELCESKKEALQTASPEETDAIREEIAKFFPNNYIELRLYLAELREIDLEDEREYLINNTTESFDTFSAEQRRLLTRGVAFEIPVHSYEELENFILKDLAIIVATGAFPRMHQKFHAGFTACVTRAMLTNIDEIELCQILSPQREITAEEFLISINFASLKEEVYIKKMEEYILKKDSDAIYRFVSVIKGVQFIPAGGFQTADRIRFNVVDKGADNGFMFHTCFSSVDIPEIVMKSEDFGELFDYAIEANYDTGFNVA
ncbi:hypothetical protein SNEBB_008890 [Seison nebaliae]|nr:hypothetical protein SNEBB_008890 [Seison nebaliae]